MTFEECSVSNDLIIGIVAQENNGKIQNCYFNNCTANTTGMDNHVGIICGSNMEKGSIVNCEINNSTVSGKIYNCCVGGTCGGNAGKVIGVKSKGLSISSYGSEYAPASFSGGITGYNYDTGIISHCEVEKSTINGSSVSGGITGCNDGQVLSCKFDGEVFASNTGNIAGSGRGVIVNN